MSGWIVSFLFPEDTVMLAAQHCRIAHECLQVLDAEGITKSVICSEGAKSVVEFDGFDPGKAKSMPVATASSSVFAKPQKSYDFYWGWDDQVRWSGSPCSLAVARLAGPLQAEDIQRLYAPITKTLGPALYGYLTPVPLGLQPAEFAFGRKHSKTEWPDYLERELEGMRVTYWLNYWRRVCEGTALRDVYPASLLSEKLLSMKVDGDSLRQWISRSAKRGVLSRLDESMTLWTIPDAREREAVREELGRAGRLIAHLSDKMVAAFKAKALSKAP